MSLREWLGRHLPDHEASHWERGSFVSRCTTCGRAMIKLPGLAWRLGGAEG
jgi:hypothetical protein